jgi:hypothetical protein
MLDLNSPLWRTIPASGGGTGVLAAELLRRIRGGDDEPFAELYHQVCHQLTVGPVAYVVVPHLVEIARTAKGSRLAWALSTVGTVVATRQAQPRRSPPLPDEWKAEYLSAVEEARQLTATALCQRDWELSDSQQLLATLAALHGHADLATHLFLAGGVTELSCPVCGEPITFSEESASPSDRPAD